ncbi:MAG: Hsp33 family molecular chaperone HslO [Pseudomarimonas sp.]
MYLTDIDEEDRTAGLLLRFIIEGSEVRGALVCLGETWRHIASRSAYPTALRELLGQSVVAAALFGGHGKINGRLSIQLKGQGAVRTLFAEYASVGRLRGIAMWHEPLPALLSPRDFGDAAMLAISIESIPPGADEATRYQGLVELDSDRLEHAFEAYFAQSEQLPTRLLLAADGERAAGLMIQQLPPPSGTAPLARAKHDSDGWTRAQALFDTLASAELLATDPETLLLRLFHEDGVRLLGALPLRFGCSCSRERVAGVLLQLGREEALAAASSQGDDVAEIACEMCAQRYRFDRVDLEQLFAGGGTETGVGKH